MWTGHALGVSGAYRPAAQSSGDPGRSALLVPVLLGDFLFALTLNTSGNVIPISLSIYQYLGQYPRSGPT